MMLEQRYKDSFDALFHSIYKGDVYAISLSHLLVDLVQFWDDLIDCDPVTGEEIQRNMHNAVVGLARSPLWNCKLAEHFNLVYLRWTVANKFEADEASSSDDIAKAWMLRAGFYDLFVAIADQLYGREWAEHIAPLVYRTYGESLADFRKEVKHG